ncbi:MAG: inorganic phosphate transporter, partial [Bacteroidaceae bacterium]|nr:inorganic phosphate transporter [Bacteroidaceae bacterium]
EQMQLFLLTSDYLQSYFDKPAWLACMTGDFFTQFYYWVGGGAVVLTFSILILGYFVHRAFVQCGFRRGTYAIAVVVMTVEAVRHFGWLYTLSSTYALIGGTGMFLIYCRFKDLSKIRNWIMALILSPLTYWLFGYGCWVFVLLLFVRGIMQRRIVIPGIVLLITIVFPLCLRGLYLLTRSEIYTYPGLGQLQKPEWITETLFGLDCETYFNHPRQVIRMARRSGLKLPQVSYFYNLAQAEQGTLADSLLTFYQPISKGLFLDINSRSSLFNIYFGNEVFYRLGAMTLTEHAAILASVFSPGNRNVRMVKRLAEVNMINNDTLGAMKYLRLLDCTLFYKTWAAKRMFATHSPSVSTWLDAKRRYIMKSDTIRRADAYPMVLRGLLNANPENRMALDYLLCGDLLNKELVGFMNDYRQYCIKRKMIETPQIYQEALLICYSLGQLTLDELKRCGIRSDIIHDLSEYTEIYKKNKGDGHVLQPLFGHTYWFYYHYATYKI